MKNVSNKERLIHIQQEIIGARCRLENLCKEETDLLIATYKKEQVFPIDLSKTNL